MTNDEGQRPQLETPPDAPHAQAGHQLPQSLQSVAQGATQPFRDAAIEGHWLFVLSLVLLVLNQLTALLLAYDISVEGWKNFSSLRMGTIISNLENGVSITSDGANEEVRPMSLLQVIQTFLPGLFVLVYSAKPPTQFGRRAALATFLTAVFCLIVAAYNEFRLMDSAIQLGYYYLDANPQAIVDHNRDRLKDALTLLAIMLGVDVLKRELRP